MSRSDITTGAAVITLNLLQREALADLLQQERKHATRWWSLLNEMRFRGELPNWIKNQNIGSHPSYERLEEDRIAFNSALFGKRIHIHHEGEVTYESTDPNIHTDY